MLNYPSDSGYRAWIRTRAPVKTTAGALKNIAIDRMSGL